MKNTRKLINNKDAYTKLVTGILALFIVIIAGIMIFWEFEDAIDVDSSDANKSINETTDMFTTLIPLMVLIGLVLVAGVLIGIISKFGG